MNEAKRPMPAPPCQPVDRNGRLLRAGDKVRIVGVPDLSGMAPECAAESRPVFEYLVGRYKKISHFAEPGLAWFDFSISGGQLKGLHGVAIEPFLLHLPRREL